MEYHFFHLPSINFDIDIWIVFVVLVLICQNMLLFLNVIRHCLIKLIQACVFCYRCNGRHFRRYFLTAMTDFAYLCRMVPNHVAIQRIIQLPPSWQRVALAPQKTWSKLCSLWGTQENISSVALIRTLKVGFRRFYAVVIMIRLKRLLANLLEYPYIDTQSLGNIRIWASGSNAKQYIKVFPNFWRHDALLTHRRCQYGTTVMCSRQNEKNKQATR